jgi:hypothetical protein
MSVTPPGGNGGSVIPKSEAGKIEMAQEAMRDVANLLGMTDEQLQKAQEGMMSPKQLKDAQQTPLPEETEEGGVIAADGVQAPDAVEGGPAPDAVEGGPAPDAVEGDPAPDAEADANLLPDPRNNEGNLDGGRRRTKRKGRKGSRKSKKGAKKSKKGAKKSQKGGRSRKNRRKQSRQRKH